MLRRSTRNVGLAADQYEAELGQGARDIDGRLQLVRSYEQLVHETSVSDRPQAAANVGAAKVCRIWLVLNLVAQHRRATLRGDVLSLASASMMSGATGPPSRRRQRSVARLPRAPASPASPPARRLSARARPVDRMGCERRPQVRERERPPQRRQLHGPGLIADVQVPDVVVGINSPDHRHWLRPALINRGETVLLRRAPTARRRRPS